MALTLPRPIQEALRQFAEANELDAQALKRIVSMAIDGDKDAAPKPDRESEPIETTLRRVRRGLALSGHGAAKLEPAPEPVDAATAALRSLAKKHGIEVKA